MPRLRVVLAASVALALASCRREDRPYRPSPATAQTVRWTRVSDLLPGPAEAADPTAARVVPGAAPDVYEENAFAISEGKRLYAAFNCSGCHSPGGGGNIGPPLIDDRWIYGREPGQIFATIVEGRPNGMPSYGARVAEYQIWWLVAYVRSLGGLAAKGAAPGRDDHMKGATPPNSHPPVAPVNSSLPKGAEMPQ